MGIRICRCESQAASCEHPPFGVGSSYRFGDGVLLCFSAGNYSTVPYTWPQAWPAIELFTGIPSVVYGFVGMTVLIPFLRKLFPMPFGFSLLAAGIVLAVMIYPTITTMAADAMTSVPKSWREASYGLGATRWETIAHIVLPAAKGGIVTGVILGLARAIGEALAVAMVIGQMKVFPKSLFLPASTLTTAISADMGGAMEGGEYSAALWTMALLLFILSFLFIFIIHTMNDLFSLKGDKR